MKLGELLDQKTGFFEQYRDGDHSDDLFEKVMAVEAEIEKTKREHTRVRELMIYAGYLHPNS